MLLVDTNVLVDVLQDDPQWANWSIGQLRAQASIHQLTINPIIYAEISLSFSTLEGLDSAVSTLALELREISRPALFLAAKALSSTEDAEVGSCRCCPTSSLVRMRRSKAGPY